MISPASTIATAAWERCTWQGEPAWLAVQGLVRAVVSEARCRLIYLGAHDGAFNLLNAPWPQVLPSPQNPWPNQGGHRFWLGPQHRWVWPPPAEWEYSPAREAASCGSVLILRHDHRDTNFPAIIREYEWVGPRLRCTARWDHNGGSYFGLHVVAVNTPFAIRARLRRTAEAPAGLVIARMVDPEAPVRLPHPAVTVDTSGHAIVRGGITTAKLGFPPQDLTIDRPHRWRLSMLPGPSGVATAETPDQGFLSQIWVGDPSYDLAELEQLSPYLSADADGTCTSTVYLEATAPDS